MQKMGLLREETYFLKDLIGHLHTITFCRHVFALKTYLIKGDWCKILVCFLTFEFELHLEGSAK